mmetsp:Transcript_36925/g.59738  ORF Transcript_36925/g.59738 Transcript_36925/m.59738 type:complete len:508 (-) Transcript_36925:937-2460(-)
MYSVSLPKSVQLESREEFREALYLPPRKRLKEEGQYVPSPTIKLERQPSPLAPSSSSYIDPNGSSAYAEDTNQVSDISASEIARPPDAHTDAPAQDGPARYCICRTSNGQGFMIMCDYCSEWYHGRCIKLSRSEAKKLGRFKCLRCEQNGVPDLPPSPQRLSQKKGGEPKRTKVKQLKRDPKPLQIPRLLAPTRKCMNGSCGNFVKDSDQYCSKECSTAAEKKAQEVPFVPSYSAAHDGDAVAAIERPHLVLPTFQRPPSANGEGRKSPTVEDAAEEAGMLSRIRENASALDRLDLERLDKMEREKVDILHRIKRLEEQREELNRAIQLALTLFATDSSFDDSADEESSSVIDCVTCGQSFPAKNFNKHVQQCYVKERMAQQPIVKKGRQPRPDLQKQMCNQYNSSTGKRCTFEKDRCILHSRQKVHKNQLCGCPLQVIGKCCEYLKRECQLHSDWENLMTMQNEKEEASERKKLETLIENERKVKRSLKQRFLTAQAESNQTVQEG